MISRFYRLDLPEGQLCPSVGIVFTHGSIFWFFATQWRHVAPIKVKFDREEWTVDPLLRARGVGLWPQKLKKMEFYQYNLHTRTAIHQHPLGGVTSRRRAIEIYECLLVL